MFLLGIVVIDELLDVHKNKCMILRSCNVSLDDSWWLYDYLWLFMILDDSWWLSMPKYDWFNDNYWPKLTSEVTTFPLVPGHGHIGYWKHDKVNQKFQLEAWEQEQSNNNLRLKQPLVVSMNGNCIDICGSFISIFQHNFWLK